MAWGYWSATAVDRGRSPRRNTSMSTPVSKYPSQQSYQHQQIQQQQQHQQQETQCPIGNSCPQASQDPQSSTVCNSPCQSPCQQSPCGSPCRSPSCRSECRSMSCRSQCHSPEFDNAPPPPQIIQCTYNSRRPSLDSSQVNFTLQNTYM